MKCKLSGRADRADGGFAGVLDCARQTVQALAAMLDNPQKLLKRWVSEPWLPGRREEHQRIDGQLVPVSEPFILDDGRIKLLNPRSVRSTGRNDQL